MLIGSRVESWAECSYHAVLVGLCVESWVEAKSWYHFALVGPCVECLGEGR